MRITIAVASAAIAVSLLVVSAPALAYGPEWCDDGSPPPNDWRFRKTGGPSTTSSMNWLNSTTSGTLDLQSGTNTLQGGVAKGMWTATAHAPSQEEIEDRDDDERDDEEEEKGEREEEDEDDD
jgi:hypothetical protein